MESSQGLTLAILGAFLFAGYLAHVTGPLIAVPRVTLLLVLGVLIGPSVFGLIPESVSDWFPFVAHIALAMVGFLLGESFSARRLKAIGARVFLISLGETLLSAALVLTALALLGAPWPLALILAAVAPATAPAAIVETLREARAKGPLSDTLRGVVAIDDAWGILAFSVLFVVAQAVTGQGAGAAQLFEGMWEIGGAILVGAGIGVPMAGITRKVRDGQTTLVEAAAFVFICSGVSTMLNVSYLLANMVMGTVVANLAHDREQPFHAIEGVAEPFLAIFFILSGFKLDISTLTRLGLWGTAYVLARAAGKFVGGWLSARAVAAPPVVRRNVGWCLLPQAGVALGLALLASNELPEAGGKALSLVIATTVIFEISGPVLTRWRLRKTGEIGQAEDNCAEA